jgi:hypothetical protein
MPEAARKPTPHGGGGPRAPVLKPTEDQRRLVERLTAFGISQTAICRWLVEDGLPCRSITTLNRQFRQEQLHGRERIMSQLGHKLLEIALSDRPNNLVALMILARKLGGPGWRGLMEDNQVLVPPESNGTPMIYPVAARERAPVDAGPVIEATINPDEEEQAA